MSLNEGDSLRQTVQSLLVSLPPDAEIVVVDDGSDDRSTDFLAAGGLPIRLVRTRGRGVAGARNLGAAHTNGATIVFADAHVDFPLGWWAPLLEALEDSAVGAVAPAIAVAGELHRRGLGLRFEGPDLEIEWLEQRGDQPYDVPILPGCCLAMRRDVFDATGGFDDGMIRSGGVDNELALRFWLFGYALRVVPQVTVVHAFRETHPYPISWRTVMHNKLRLAVVHFGAERLGEVTAALQDHDGFADGLALIANSDAESRRRSLHARRLRDDAWYFERFGLWS